jgi:hypothetical protein
VSLWRQTGLGTYDISTKEGNTFSTIESAFDSYDRAIDTLSSLDVPIKLRRQLTEVTSRYYLRLSIDSRQNMEPIFENPQKTICRACQYAQASLVRDLHKLYRSLIKVRELKTRIDEILKVDPRTINVRLSLPGTDFGQVKVSYLDIRDPESAAQIIGLLNSSDELLEDTAHYTLSDYVLEKVFSEATPRN